MIKEKLAIFLSLITFSCSVLATGIPVIDPGAPVKVSKSNSFHCDESGNALMDGQKLTFKKQSVICKNDNLIADGKALSIIDLISDTLYEGIVSEMTNEETEKEAFIRKYMSERCYLNRTSD